MTDLVILSEGSKDIEFLEGLFQHVLDCPRIDKLNLENTALDPQQAQEARKIRNFSEPYNPYEILIKAEGGKSNLKTAFTYIAKSLATKNIRLFLMFDLDGGDIRGIVDNINEKLAGIYQGNQVYIEQNASVEQLGPVHTTMLNIVVNDSIRGEFGIIGFETTLENTAGIASHDEDQDEISECIHSLSTDPEVADPITEFVI